jgi:hypothetical protein
MPHLRRMIHGLVTSTREKLWRDLLLLDVSEDGQIKSSSVELPALDLDTLFNNPSELRGGWNFFKDPRN